MDRAACVPSSVGYPPYQRVVHVPKGTIPWARAGVTSVVLGLKDEFIRCPRGIGSGVEPPGDSDFVLAGPSVATDFVVPNADAPIWVFVYLGDRDVLGAPDRDVELPRREVVGRLAQWVVGSRPV